MSCFAVLLVIDGSDLVLQSMDGYLCSCGRWTGGQFMFQISTEISTAPSQCATHLMIWIAVDQPKWKTFDAAAFLNKYQCLLY
jgi:hypothetical protein